MAWWQKMVFPVKRAFVAVTARVKSRKDGGGILELHDDVQSCEYHDVQVMWEMLRRSEMERSQGSKRRRSSTRSSHTSPCCPSAQHHHH